MNDNLQVRQVNYGAAGDRDALVELLDLYARDPMGGGEGLADEVKARLCDDLAAMPGAVSFIAWSGDKPLGLLNAMPGYSTFKARPLMNIHDIAVRAECRGRGVGQALLEALEKHARARGCCKLTLEVLSGNAVATRSYLRFGFEQYALDPAAGYAMFMQKWL
ncbi:MAG: GNAT family N-acetyltransferase [Burkholderiaceae bacterium]|nr:GNAT family N-acetyltransferase [Burkholderiaceae bacterium]